MLKIGDNIKDAEALKELPKGAVVAATLTKTFIKTGPDLFAYGPKAYSSAQLSYMGLLDTGLLLIALP